ncbi:MAG TPA: hypothetical protein VMU81_03710 [Acetobacteraceae bacterium]|nr:hypothetical protein [Acetobacteraceae bacterium]
MTLQRIFAVLSAILLVGAVAAATLGPPSVPLGQVLLMVDHDLTETLRTAIEQHLAAWLWLDVAQPLLVRPAWLVPASLGLICAGAAFSVSARKAAGRTHRRSQR